MKMKIDSHHHFWKYDPETYSWMNEKMELLQRDYLPQNLKDEIDKVGVEGVVSVQADQSIKETEQLLGYADSHDFILGVVGWLPLSDQGVENLMERYSSNPLLKGIRHVVQDEPDDRFILDEAFNRGVEKLRKYNLVYDILIYERQLGSTIEFVDRHKGQVFVLDHVAKPRIQDKVMEPWKTQMKELAKRENVFCKLSGMATEANWQNWQPEDLHPYMEVALDAFGAKRLMFGSDWPVARLAVEYHSWIDLCRMFVSSLTVDEQGLIGGEVAREVYDL